ncbi:regenerating islet-derived protein 3-gamma-like [Erinaceus europaeus]|uniref:Regenerating islet-derived protein 3-gamma-like n=1 Tax=Erinaceus europaeus TaxID=9365 RepID=A0ABM3XS76_ERIEU|nr:regenerating islet-derived protein 3-gamma-like [Erinaceus europaeus]
MPAVMAFPSVSWMLLFCLVLLCRPAPAEDLQKEVLSPRISCPQGSVAYASHCYALYLTPRSWMDADMDCQKRPSGHLVSVLSGSEGSFVASVINNSLNTYSTIWIGLHDPTEGIQPNGNGWEWSSTDVLNYRAWEKYPPSGSYPGFCGGVTKSSGFKKWKDFNCDLELPYVCKFTD